MLCILLQSQLSSSADDDASSTYCIFFGKLHIFKQCPFFLQLWHSAVPVGHTCCLDQFGAPNCPHQLSLYFYLWNSGRFLLLSCPDFSDDFLFWGLSCTCFTFLQSFELFEPCSRSHMYPCFRWVIVSMVMLLFRILFLMFVISR